MAVRVFVDHDPDPQALQDRLNAALARIPDEDVKNVQLSTHSITGSVIHVGRIIYQEDDE